MRVRGYGKASVEEVVGMGGSSVCGRGSFVRLAGHFVKLFEKESWKQT